MSPMPLESKEIKQMSSLCSFNCTYLIWNKTRSTKIELTYLHFVCFVSYSWEQYCEVHSIYPISMPMKLRKWNKIVWSSKSASSTSKMHYWSQWLILSRSLFQHFQFDIHLVYTPHFDVWILLLKFFCWQKIFFENILVSEQKSCIKWSWFFFS